MYSDVGNTPSRALGSPIRTPSDHSSVGSSPRLIAASYVLHRLLVPRHPPCALTHLHSQTIKDARVHCAVLKQHTPTPPTPETDLAYRGSVPPETTRPSTNQAQRCCLRHPTVCFIRTTLPPKQPALSRHPEDQGESYAIVFHPIEPPSAPHSDANQAQTLTPPTGEVSAP